MQAKERVIIVKWVQYYVPTVTRVQDTSGNDYFVRNSERIKPDSMVTLELVSDKIEFPIQTWQVKESETIDAGTSS